MKTENKEIKPNMFSEFKSFENKNSFQKMKIGNENANQTHPNELQGKKAYLKLKRKCLLKSLYRLSQHTLWDAFNYQFSYVTT